MVAQLERMQRNTGPEPSVAMPKDIVTEASEESFPASDPPSFTPLALGPPAALRPGAATGTPTAAAIVRHAPGSLSEFSDRGQVERRTRALVTGLMIVVAGSGLLGLGFLLAWLLIL